MIYLDHAATSPPLKGAMGTFMGAQVPVWGNPNSIHSFGQATRKAFEASREGVALCLGCEPDQVFFVSSATEACRIALTIMNDKCSFVTASFVEHLAVTSITDHMIPICRIDNKLHGAAHICTNNETGRIYDLSKDFVGCDIKFSDYTAAMGKQEINFRESGIDFICGSGHKFGTPIGIGVLIARNPDDVTENFHFGTPSAPLAAAFVDALEFRTNHLDWFAKATGVLHDRLIDGIMNEIPDAQLNGCEYLGHENVQSPYIANISFPGIENHALVLRLSADGLMVSAGAACSSGDNAPSRVLLASGYSEERARSAIRFSFDYKLARYVNDMEYNYGLNLERDIKIIDEAVKIVAQNVREMRDLSSCRG